MHPILLRLLLVAAIVGLAAVVGRWLLARNGRLREYGRGGTQPGRRLRPWTRGWRNRGRRRRDDTAGRFDRAQLDAVGLGRGSEVSALLLSSPTCAPCRTVRRVLAEVSEARPHFHWVSVDAGAYLDIARDHHVLRVPTLFVLDRDGWILARTSGVPATRDLLRVIDRDADGLGETTARAV